MSTNESLGGGDAAIPPSDIPAPDTTNEPDTFPREYVERLRAEAAENRTKARDAQQAVEQMRTRYAAFEDYDDQDFAAWTQLATNYRTDPSAAADLFADLASAIRNDPNMTAQEKQTAMETNTEQQQVAKENPQLTAEQVAEVVEQRLAAREQEQAQRAQQDAAVKEINDTLASAGYEPGSMGHAAILWAANNVESVKGDLNAAIEYYQADRRGEVDQFIAQRTQNATPVPTADHGVPGQQQAQPETDFRKIASNAQEWLKSQPSLR